MSPLRLKLCRSLVASLLSLCLDGGVGWPCEWHKSGSSLSSLKVRSLIEVAGAMGMAGVGTSAHESQTEYLPLSHGSWCVVLNVVIGWSGIW